MKQIIIYSICLSGIFSRFGKGKDNSKNQPNADKMEITEKLQESKESLAELKLQISSISADLEN
ncbi:MAG: hypothetical protein GF364_16560 [Candidatus Lokiarchaeota archaeon]|nr:hypothetical protein [Candidatus Lokiarchaeota archaeon]